MSRPNPQPRTLIVARDPGAASALSPVARTGPATVIGTGHARAIFQREHVPFEETDDAVGALERRRPAVLLTGTSLRANLDASWWRAARSLGIPSVGLVDHWSNLLARFTASEPFDSHPDVIAVIDMASERELVDLGCPAPLSVTGQPAFDAILEAAPDGRAGARARWDVGPERRVLLFASEPIVSDVGPAASINELIALRMVLDAADGWRIVIRPHPRENPDALRELAKDRATVDATASPHDAIAGADAVVGVSSVFLVEAALAGRPVISLDPGPASLGLRFPYLIASGRDVEDVRRWLQREGGRTIKERERVERNARSGFARGATGRVWSLLEKLS